MHLEQYFENRQGRGILATAGASGVVTTAIYAKPHFMEDETLAFLMRERLSYANLTTNDQACYMFIEQGEGAKGIRLYLQKIDESDDAQLIAAMTRRHLSPEQDSAKGPKHLVRFRVVKVLPLVGDGQVAL
jgi:hypothetical protein